MGVLQTWLQISELPCQRPQADSGTGLWGLPPAHGGWGPHLAFFSDGCHLCSASRGVCSPCLLHTVEARTLTGGLGPLPRHHPPSGSPGALLIAFQRAPPTHLGPAPAEPLGLLGTGHYGPEGNHMAPSSLGRGSLQWGWGEPTGCSLCSPLALPGAILTLCMVTMCRGRASILGAERERG